MKKAIYIFAAAALLLCLASCSEKKKSSLPSTSGKAGEIIVVTGKSQWSGEIGNALRHALASDYGYLPQDEPRFDLMNVPAPGVTRIIKVHRNMVYVNVEDTLKCNVTVRKDVWASPQTMVIITAPDEASAAEFITSKAELIYKAFEKAERDRNMFAAQAFENGALRKTVESVYGGSPYFPESYSLKKKTRDFIWISYETSFTTQGIFIYDFPYEGDFQLEKDYLVAKRDEVMKANVPATTEGSYMITNPQIDAGFATVCYNGITRSEIRSLWDTHNDFMGGPFLQQAFRSKDGNSIIVVEGFVYAPKYNKRDYIRQVDGIISTFHWSE